MVASPAPFRKQRGRLVLALLAGWGGVLWADPALAQIPAPVLPILTPPPATWDHDLLSARPALGQTLTDLSVLTGGLTWGMTPVDVNGVLPVRVPGINWAGLASATEYQSDIRYFWARLDSLGALRVGSTACVGRNSYVVFLFQASGLFRLSYRLTGDPACPNPGAAASQIFGRYVAMEWSLAQSIHYRAGGLDIIDVTDPTAGYLTTIRWQPRAR